MGIIKNITNLFATRSFVRREIKKEREEAIKEITVYMPQLMKHFAEKELMDKINTMMRESYLSTKVQSAVNNFLQSYYGKKHLGDYSTHFVSYYYASFSGVANLGDYIQTIATEQAIKKCAQRIGMSIPFENVLRSSLTEHSGGTCVMQGWYEHQQLTFLPGPDTRPVWIGTHFCSDARNLLKGLYDSSSIRFQDIGCRDKSTMAFCQSLGMTSYFSRCLTLTLPKRDDNEAQKANTIYIVDCSNVIMKYLPNSIKDGAKILSQRNYKFDNWMDWKQCRIASENLLKEYKQNAKLVITTALHCAQPCLAMGIPVVFIKPDYNEEDRFSSMDGITTLYSLSDLKEGKVKFEVETPHFEDLKSALIRNLELSIKENLTDEEIHERTMVRTFIGQYSIFH